MIWTRLYYADWSNLLGIVTANVVIAAAVLVGVCCVWLGNGIAAAYLGMVLRGRPSQHDDFTNSMVL